MIPDLTKTSVLIAVVSLAGLCVGARGAESSGFHSYYTRLPYQDDNNTGKYADIVVNLNIHPESNLQTTGEQQWIAEAS